MNTGINRIRLEFKALLKDVKNYLDIRINRIRLEFKVKSAIEAAKDTYGLIESDWNLKSYSV